jgi:membrane protease YdiL (CAAX protease family)
MAKTPGGFRAALLIGWIALGAAGVLFARSKSIPAWTALPFIAAFLLAYSFYLVPAFPKMRDRLAGKPLALYLAGAALLPYLVSCLGAVEFHWWGLVRIAALPGVLGLWYVVLPAVPIVDLAFLALIPLILLGKYFDPVYATHDPTMQKYAVFLGHLTLISLSITVLLVKRRVRDLGYGFVPSRVDWRVGVMHYLYFLAVGFPLALLLKAVSFTAPDPAWKIAGTFLGFLWVVALSEEFFFRGVLQDWIEMWTWSRTGALAIASVLFGLVHLGFRGFPNWRWALVVTVLGWLCGRARYQAGTIRAGVVTHALAVATWQGFFR